LGKKIDENEVLLGHDEMSYDESEGDLEFADADPEELEDSMDADMDLDSIAFEEEDEDAK
jgi:hypothetical protein